MNSNTFNGMPCGNGLLRDVFPFCKGAVKSRLQVAIGYIAATAASFQQGKQ